MIFTPSFKKTGTDVQAILRFCLKNNLRGCNVSITDCKGFMSYTIQMGSGAVIYITSFIRLVQAFKNCYGGGGFTHTDTQAAR
jgi:hypothetical protein